MKKEIGDYNNEIGGIYSGINLIKKGKKEIYRKINGLKESDYIFSKVSQLRTFQERYAPGELKEILSENAKEKLKYINSRAMKINNLLKEESEKISDFEKPLNEIITTINPDKSGL